MTTSPTTDLAERSPARELVRSIRSDDFKQQLKLALPDGVTVDRFTRATVTALLQNPDIARAEPDSLFQAVLRSAQDGLIPDGREAALVMFGGKATYMPMIGGFRKIAAEHGWSLQTSVVYANDEFDYELGLDQRLTHRPVRPGIERGDRIAAYAVAKHRDGRREFEVMTAVEIEQIRQVSRTKDSGPWRDWTDRMWEKSVGRRLFAKLPLDASDTQAARIRQMLDELEPGEAAHVLYGTELSKASPVSPVEDAAAGDPPVDHGTGVAVPQAAAADSDPLAGTDGPVAAAAPVDPPEPGDEVAFGDAPAGVSAERQAADKAAGFVPPNGKYGDGRATRDKKAGAQGPKTFAEIHQSDAKWFEWALANIEKPDDYRQALLDFTRVHAPEAYAKAVQS